MLDVTRMRVLEAIARTGSVTAAARELNYSQPSVSHHIARLERESGAQLLQRVGRGVRLTEAGRVLAERAAEILGRLDAAGAELASYVSLGAGRLRIAAYSTAVVALLPPVAARLSREHPGLQLEIVDTHPPEALEMLRRGAVDAAVVFRYDDEREEGPIRLQHLRDDPTYVLTRDPVGSIRALADETWVGGCERCTQHLVELCESEGFAPRIRYSTDDMVAIQALVAAGMGAATIPGLALAAHRHPDIVATELPGAERHIFLATYGEPPDPPPIAALRAALARGL
ncbi:LysR family transcriptional regulator [Microbacterium sp. 8M]|uniref:LysR family transcriptional regulator n=1 Tax=Microbacterium sp. 8M TaxID=2653153 RepID=UPI001356BB8C|nr:LysR family transcriptional regulator [Microbacterium sp. 8M]